MAFFFLGFVSSKYSTLAFEELVTVGSSKPANFGNHRQGEVEVVSRPFGERFAQQRPILGAILCRGQWALSLVVFSALEQMRSSHRATFSKGELGLKKGQSGHV
ncbi:hypothetical protein CIHG_06929 [Coccidioides immitis H538.4]|uniref:Uncharacterized protein n=3 Tax=Coccidioides immitis TaxID=5501 RepID=A0A0J8R2I3_COCIT|nr:hypothetical protein CIRG_09974 [Coccidioides immitis RMSCC 2394]KMU78535.1 hypothetical protein CISG_07195 [Coccidioides immitis RMSCC 3703]KMU89259.1 hypothetical protein CIHG_06929 [Coccidioides immitis H538.4]